MSYKIIRITNLYNEYLTQYRVSFPAIHNLTYAEQYVNLINNSFDTASSISKSLRNLGIDAVDIFTNVHELQNKWKEENNCDESGNSLLYEQVKAAQPDVVWIDNISIIDSEWVKEVRNTIKSVKIITGLICAPYSARDLETLRSFNFVIACTPGLMNEIIHQGMKCHLVYHGFDVSILDRISDENNYPIHELLFTGSLYVGGGFHKTRIEYLEKFLNENIPVDIYGGIDSGAKIVKKLTAYYVINGLRKLGFEKHIRNTPLLSRYETYGDTPIKFYSSRLKNSLHFPVYGIEQFKLLAKAKICFNIHGEIAKGCAGNLRLFEATGVATCLVTDWKENLAQLFEADKEVITYRSSDECIDKIKWLMNNPKEAQKIGKAGQARTLKDHTIENRAKQINRILINSM
jgi:spore maturation protein CgeB